MFIQTTNPRTGLSTELTIRMTTPEETASIIEGAARGSIALRASSRAQRAELLNTIAEELELARPELTEITDRETALGSVRLNGELTRTIFQLKEFAAAVTEGSVFEPIIKLPQETEMGPNPDLRRVLVPLGTVAVFGASNFPYAFGVCGGDAASAIAAGCSVIAKAHSSHPETSLELYRCMQRAFIRCGFEADACGIVFGQEAARALVQAETVKAVGFTGSYGGGKMLADLAAARPEPIPFYGELGSVNPLVVSPQAAELRAKEIASDYKNSITLGGGQFCTKPGLIFVPKSSSEQLKKHLGEEFSEADPVWLLNRSTFNSYSEHINQLKQHPSIVDSIETQRETSQEGFSAKPILLATESSLVMEHFDDVFTECFGPMAIRIEYENYSDLLNILSSMPGALCAAVHAEESEFEDLTPVVDVLTQKVGRIVWNGYTTGLAVSAAQTHGGPYPSSTNSLHTSVGITAIRRFLRPVTFQSFPGKLLPSDLRTE